MIIVQMICARCSEERLSDELQGYHSLIADPKIVSATLSSNPEGIKQEG
jgi:hypothetical protein